MVIRKNSGIFGTSKFFGKKLSTFNDIVMAEWKDLSMGERNEIIEMAVQNGINDLEQIKRMYNNASKGIDERGIYETTPSRTRKWTPTVKDIMDRGNLKVNSKENLEVLKENRRNDVPSNMVYSVPKNPKREYTKEEYEGLIKGYYDKESNDLWEKIVGKANKYDGKDWYNPMIVGNDYGSVAFNYSPNLTDSERRTEATPINVYGGKPERDANNTDKVDTKNARLKENINKQRFSSLADRGFIEGGEVENPWGTYGLMYRTKEQVKRIPGYRVYRGEGELDTNDALKEPPIIKREIQENFFDDEGSTYAPNALYKGNRYGNQWNMEDSGSSYEEGGPMAARRDNIPNYLDPDVLALKTASRFNADYAREQSMRNHGDETVVKYAPYAFPMQDSTGFITPRIYDLPVPYEGSVENVYPEMMLMGLNLMKKAPVERTTGIKNRVFKDTGLGLGKNNPNRFQTMPGNAYRITGREQIDDMVSSGYVRPRAGKMKGGRSNEVHWAEGQDKLMYTDTDRFILQSKPSIDNTTKALRTKDLDAVWQFNGTNWENILNKGKLNIKNR